MRSQSFMLIGKYWNQFIQFLKMTKWGRVEGNLNKSPYVRNCNITLNLSIQQFWKIYTVRHHIKYDVRESFFIAADCYELFWKKSKSHQKTPSRKRYIQQSRQKYSTAEKDNWKVKKMLPYKWLDWRNEVSTRWQIS